MYIQSAIWYKRKSILIRRARDIGLIICFLHAAGGAESAICKFGGDTFVGALSLGMLLPEPEYRFTRIRPNADKSVLALLVAFECPTTVERTISQERSNAKVWLAALRSNLEIVLSTEQIQPKLSFLSSKIYCSTSTPNLCLVRKQLWKLSGNPSSHSKVGVCDTIGSALIEGLAKDLTEADGAFIISGTGDIANVLAFCPDQFYAFMHAHASDFQAWLQHADQFLFWGDIQFKLALEKYRSEMIRHVKSSLNRGGFESEKKVVLEHFVRAKVTFTE